MSGGNRLNDYCNLALSTVLDQGAPLVCPVCRTRHQVDLGGLTCGDSFSCSCGFAMTFSEEILHSLREPIKGIRQALRSLNNKPA